MTGDNVFGGKSEDSDDAGPSLMDDDDDCGETPHRAAVKAG